MPAAPLQIDEFLQKTPFRERYQGEGGLYFEQHDCHEFLSYILDPSKGIVSDECMKAFDIQYRTVIKCCGCSQETITMGQMTMLDLNFSEMESRTNEEVSLCALLERFSACTDITDSSCEKCGHKVRKLRRELIKLPNLLLVMFNRAGLDGAKRWRNEVLLPERTLINETAYSLRAVLKHSGQCANSGHYVAERYIVDKAVWVLASDEDIVPNFCSGGDIAMALFSAEACNVVARPRQVLHNMIVTKTTDTRQTRPKPENNNPTLPITPAAAKAYVLDPAEALHSDSSVEREGNIKHKQRETHQAEDFERDPRAAMRQFYSQSLPDVISDPSSLIITDETKAQCLKKYRELMRDDVLVCCCAVCGILKIGEESKDVPLDSRLLKYLACQQVNTTGLSTFNYNGIVFHGNPALVGDTTMKCCKSCHQFLEEARCVEELPPSSFARLDLGGPPDDLPKLSVLEKVVLQRCHPHRTVIRISCRGGAFIASARSDEKFKGHVISFSHDKDNFIEKFLEVASLDQVTANVDVVMVGKTIDQTRRKLAYERLTSIFAVRMDVIGIWLDWLTKNNDSYRHLGPNKLTEDFLVKFRARIIANTVCSEGDTALSGLCAEATATAANCPTDNNDTTTFCFVTQRSPLAEVGSSRRVAEAIKSRISGRPINEYENLRDILLGGFPWLFSRWICPRNTLEKKQMRALLLRLSSKVAIDPGCIFYFCDLLMRRAVSKEVAVAVKGNPEQLAYFERTLGAKDFDSLLDKAIKDPNSKEARVIQAQVLAFVQSCTKKINFSPGKRAACKGPLYAMYRRYGLPSFWITISPNDNDGILALRLSCGKTTAEFPLPSLSERARIIANNPVWSTVVFDRMVNAVCEALFGIKTTTRSLSSKDKSVRGIFGDSRGFFGVVECQKRGCLHLHLVLWAGPSPHEVSKILADPELNRKFGEAMDTILCSSIPEEYWALVRAVHSEGTFASRCAMQYRPATHPIPEILSSSFYDHVYRSAVDVQCHIGHRVGCFPPQKGSAQDRKKQKCRFTFKGVVQLDPTRVYFVEEAPDPQNIYANNPEERPIRLLEAIPHLPPPPEPNIFPFRVRDDRPLIFFAAKPSRPDSKQKSWIRHCTL